MQEPAARILVVEDEPTVRRSLERGLAAEGYTVVSAGTGEDGFFRVTTERYDAVVLDIMLPGRSGLEVLAGIRLKVADIPVLLLTARDAVEDRVNGLDAGADDYLVKPFAFDELLARLRVMLRRGRAVATKLACADLEIDLLARRATRADRTLHLTVREFDLLEFLLRHVGSVVSRDMLARYVWKETGRITPLDNVIDATVARLRKKVDEPFTRPLIHTVRGIGFRLSGEPS
ncbi:MAG: response regulator transcription factor [Phycisphaerales bacterium]|nr:response regulator transcription factor [Phycisphaerales bacterium]